MNTLPLRSSHPQQHSIPPGCAATSSHPDSSSGDDDGATPGARRLLDVLDKFGGSVGRRSSSSSGGSDGEGAAGVGAAVVAGLAGVRMGVRAADREGVVWGEGARGGLRAGGSSSSDGQEYYSP